MTVTGQTTYFVYDGVHVIADVNTNGSVLRTYQYGPGVDNVLSMTVYGASTQTYYYLKDHLGSVLALTDHSGSIVESYEYDAWGRTTDYDASRASRTESAFGNRYTSKAENIPIGQDCITSGRAGMTPSRVNGSPKIPSAWRTD